MKAEIFTKTPNELKTIEVDVEKKIFNVNGVPFAEGCTGFYISADAANGYKVSMEIDTTVHFSSYSTFGEKIADYAYEKHSQQKLQS